MSLGKKLRQARLEAGLSQRALCGDAITRNMLSQIENGSAQPSMATLQYLAGQLQKPISYFLGEEARTAPSPLADGIACLEKARQLLALDKATDAAAALQAADTLLEDAPSWLRRQYLLLLGQQKPEQAGKLVAELPSLDAELLLRAQAALEEKNPERAKNLLLAAESQTPYWHLLLGQALLALQDYPAAAAQLHRAESQFPHRTSAALEICYRELEDYQKAYFYACRVRNLTGK